MQRLKYITGVEGEMGGAAASNDTELTTADVMTEIKQAMAKAAADAAYLTLSARYGEKIAAEVAGRESYDLLLSELEEELADIAEGTVLLAESME